MARQTITLDFKANIEQAKTSLVALAQAYRTASESGDPQQQSQVNQLLEQRSASMGAGGLSMDGIANELEQAVALQKEYETGVEKQIELQKSALRIEEEVRQINREKNSILEEASRILGKDNTLKITELRSEFALLQKNNEELEKKGQLTEEDRQKAQQTFDLLQRYGNSLDDQTEKNKEAKDVNAQSLAIDKQREEITDKIGVILEKIGVTEDEKRSVMAELLQMSVETAASQKKSLKSAERIAEESRKIKNEQKEIASTLAKSKDSFAGKAVTAFLYFQALSALRRVARAAVATLRELDKALTDIAVVTSMSREESFKLLGTYQEMAKRVGLTTTEVANLSIAFFRQGRSARDALQLTETAAKFAKIAAIDVNDAANFLTAAINGFNLATSEAERIIDRFAALGAGAAASASEIAIALSKVAPAAASAGVEIDNLMAFVTKGIETTREAPENIGTAFKTIFARMRELTDIGKVMEDGMDVNRVETALASVGVSLRDANGQFRNLDQVLIDLGGKWDLIDRNSQAYLATTLAGTRQQTRLIALFEDFDRTLELIEISQGSAGVATIQHTEFMQGMETATKRLQTTFQELITSFVNSEQVIFIINALDTTLGILNTTVGRTIVVMTALAAIISSVASGTGKLAFVKKGLVGIYKGQLLTSLTSYTAALTTARTAINEKRKRLADHTTELRKNAATTSENTLATYKQSLINLKSAKTKNANVTSTVALTNATNKNTLAKKRFTQQGILASIQTIKLAKADVIEAKAKLASTTGTKAKAAANLKLAAAQKIARLATLGLTKAILFSPLFMFALLAGAAFLISKAFKALRPPVNKAAESFEGLQERIGKSNEELRNLNSEAQKLQKTLQEFQRLSNLRFINPQEAARMKELETQLQLDLNSSLTGDALIELAQREQQRIQDSIIAATAERSKEISDFFKKHPLANFDDLRTTDLLSDEAKANLDKVAVEYATSLIDGFNNLAPEVQEAQRRMIAEDPGRVIDAVVETGRATSDQAIQIGHGHTLLEGHTFMVKAGEDAATAYNRAVAEGLIGDNRGSKNRFMRQFESINTKAITDPILDAGGEIAAAYASMGTVGFAEAATNINRLFDTLTQGMDPEEIENALSILSAAVPSIEGFVSLTADQIARLDKVGGMAALKDFNIFENLAQTMFKDASGNYDAAAGDVFLNDILNRLLTANPEDRAAIGTQMIDEVMAGLTNVPPNARARVARAIENAILPDNLEGLIASSFNANTAMERAQGLMGKGISATAEDLAFLTERFPKSVGEILNGTADINQLQEEHNASILAQLAIEKETLKIILAQKVANGEQNQDVLDAMANEILLVELAEDRLKTLRESTDAVKSRFDAERETLKLQRQAIDDAKKLRELQEKGREASALSTQATRIGVVGTLEARFNQDQLQTQIKQMNRDLEERIQIAKIEAQDRILADTQSKQLLTVQGQTVDELSTLNGILKQAREDADKRPTLAGQTNTGGSPNGSTIEDVFFGMNP